MGATESVFENNIDFNKKLYIVIDLYMKQKCNYKNNFDIDNFKSNEMLKKNLKDIIISALYNKCKYNVKLSDNNVILVSKKDKDGVNYLELNAIIEFENFEIIKIEPKMMYTGMSTYNDPKYILKNDALNITTKMLKLLVLSEFFKCTSNEYSIIINNDILLILDKTINHIDVYQK